MPRDFRFDLVYYNERNEYWEVINTNGQIYIKIQLDQGRHVTKVSTITPEQFHREATGKDVS